MSSEFPFTNCNGVVELPPPVYKFRAGHFAGKTIQQVPGWYLQEVMNGGDSQLANKDETLFWGLRDLGYKYWRPGGPPTQQPPRPEARLLAHLLDRDIHKERDNEVTVKRDSVVSVASILKPWAAVIEDDPDATLSADSETESTAAIDQLGGQRDLPISPSVSSANATVGAENSIRDATNITFQPRFIYSLDNTTIYVPETSSSLTPAFSSHYDIMSFSDRADRANNSSSVSDFNTAGASSQFRSSSISSQRSGTSQQRRSQTPYSVHSRLAIPPKSSICPLESSRSSHKPSQVHISSSPSQDDPYSVPLPSFSALELPEPKLKIRIPGYREMGLDYKGISAQMGPQARKVIDLNSEDIGMLNKLEGRKDRVSRYR